MYFPEPTAFSRAIHSWHNALPWCRMKPKSASSFEHNSQRKHFGCQLAFIALITLPMMNSSANCNHISYWLMVESRMEVRRVQTLKFNVSTYYTCRNMGRIRPGSRVRNIFFLRIRRIHHCGKVENTEHICNREIIDYWYNTFVKN